MAREMAMFHECCVVTSLRRLDVVWKSLLMTVHQGRRFRQYICKHHWLTSIGYANSSRPVATRWLEWWNLSGLKWNDWVEAQLMPTHTPPLPSLPPLHTYLPTPFPIHTQLISLKAPTRQKWLMGWRNTDNTGWLHVAGTLRCSAATAVREMGRGTRGWNPCWTGPLAISEFINHILHILEGAVCDALLTIKVYLSDYRIIYKKHCQKTTLINII